MAIADIFEAYSSNRSYHKERTMAETIEFIQKVNGLDQEILNIFLSHIDVDRRIMKFQ